MWVGKQERVPTGQSTNWKSTNSPSCKTRKSTNRREYQQTELESKKVYQQNVSQHRLQFWFTLTTTYQTRARAKHEQAASIHTLRFHSADYRSMRPCTQPPGLPISQSCYVQQSPIWVAHVSLITRTTPVVLAVGLLLLFAPILLTFLILTYTEMI